VQGDFVEWMVLRGWCGGLVSGFVLWGTPGVWLAGVVYGEPMMVLGVWPLSVVAREAGPPLALTGVAPRGAPSVVALVGWPPSEVALEAGPLSELTGGAPRGAPSVVALVWEEGPHQDCCQHQVDALGVRCRW
jgi:hypothetical protein